MNKAISNKLAIAIILPFLLGFGLILLYRQEVQDWLHFLSYEPDARIELLAEKAGMSEAGERLFFRADPEFISKTQVGQLCPGVDNLGCLVDGPKIYILEPDSDAYSSDEESQITAAHEMLHMVYFRLSPDERESINVQLENFLDNNPNAKFERILSGTDTEEEYFDEAYALVGTEATNLPSGLKDHYQEFLRLDQE